MNKSKKIVLSICIFVLILVVAKFSWNEFFSNIIPWEKSSFWGYGEYLELLEDQNFYASYYFVKEIPKENIGIEYYVKRSYKEKYTAYSIVLVDEYEKKAEEEVSRYLELCKDSPQTLIYTLQEDRWGIDDLKQAGAEVDFIQNVMQNPNEQQEYYCLVVVRIGTGIYTGVILNDTTKEVIEFSVEVPERELNSEEKVDAEDTIFSKTTFVDKIILFGNMVKYYLDKQLGF